MSDRNGNKKGHSGFDRICSIFFLKLCGEYVGIQAMVPPFLMPKIFYDIFKVKEKLENTFSQLKNFFKNFKSQTVLISILQFYREKGNKKARTKVY